MIPDGSAETASSRSAWAGLVREHPGLLLTAGYLALTIIGLLDELWFYVIPIENVARLVVSAEKRPTA